MREILAKIIFISVDLLIILLAIYFADFMRGHLSELFVLEHTASLSNYNVLFPLFVLPIMLFAYEGIYTYRYDFWHESRLIFKGLLFSGLLMFAYLAMTKSIGVYSRSVILFSFVLMAIMLPLSKNFIKKLLFRLKLWQKSAKIFGDDPFLSEEIYGNPYLGYTKASDDELYNTVFINSKDNDPQLLKMTLSSEIRIRKEVIFVPLVDAYDLTYSHIYELANTRTNLIVFQNRLKSKYRLLFKRITDLILSIIIFPFLILPMVYIALRIRNEEPKSSIFFKQERLGLEGKEFTCYKFRTMYENGDTLLSEYLKKYPAEIEYYKSYHKYQNDPRITKIGKLLRRTSLDELPQIFNVFMQDMSFIGPRPYMSEEKEEVGEDLDIILAVRPGITGLWQVSGRSEVNFASRIELDKWYIRNWNLWMDMVILIKTIKTVFLKEGAK